MNRSPQKLSFVGLLLILDATIGPVAFSPAIAAAPVARAASVPSPGNSTCPSTVTIGTGNACQFEVVVRDLENNLMDQSTVIVDFGGCPIALCSSQPAGMLVDLYTNTVQATTDVWGVARFHILATSSGEPCTATIYADGVRLCAVDVERCASDLEFFQVDWISDLDQSVIDSEFGDLVVRIQPGAPAAFLNVMIADPALTMESWTVRNLPIPDASTLLQPLDMRVLIDLVGIGAIQGTPLCALLYSATLDQMSRTEPPAKPQYQHAVVGDHAFVASGATDSSGASGGGLVGSFLWPTTVPHPPAIESDDDRFGHFLSVDEEVNECGPGSVTRNLFFLRDRNPTRVGMDAAIDTPAELLDKYKTYSHWRSTSGIDHEELLEGKTKLTGDHPDLNVYTKFMASTARVPGGDYVGTNKTIALREANTPPTWDWIKSEIDKGEAIELYVNWTNAQGNRSDRGHIMSIVNYVGSASGANRGILVQHDEGQGVHDGRNHVRWLQWLTRQDGTPYLSHFRGNVIDMAVSQSPQTEAVVDTPARRVNWGSAKPGAAKVKLKLGPGKTGRFRAWKIGADGSHPKYEEFTWTNTGATPMEWEFTVPDDRDPLHVAGRTNGAQFEYEGFTNFRPQPNRKLGGSTSGSILETRFVSWNGSSWELHPWTSVSAEAVRIPMLASNGGAPVYAIVDIATYVSANPLGPSSGAWTIGTSLNSLNLDISTGTSPGLDGVWFSLSPFVFDEYGSLPFVPQGGPADWLDRGDYEALHGPITIVQEVEFGDGAVSDVEPTREVAIDRLLAEPNPFQGNVTIRFVLERSSGTDARIFDATGRVVRHLQRGPRNAGEHQLLWDGSNDRGERLPAGLYFVRLQAGARNLKCKVLLLK